MKTTRSPQPTGDPTNPSHYTRLTPEPADVVEAWGLGWHLGSALQYIARAGHKGDAETDLRKAIWFLNRYIERVLHKS